MKYQSILLGADPEVFVFDTKNNEIVSSEGIVGGSKENPLYIGNEGCAVQEDNVLAEFCIPPSKNKTEFRENIIFMKDFLNSHLKEYNPNYGILCIPSGEIDSRFLTTQQALKFGCEPDFNVWQKSANIMAEDAAGKNLRSAGGHIHVGYDEPTIPDQERLVKCMDIVFGTSSIILDSDTKRRSLYGKAGAFRFKPYGIEYRTPSNFWIETEDLIDLAYDLTHVAIKYANDESFNPDNYSKVEDIINNNDIKKAIEVLDELKINNTMDFVHVNALPIIY